ncbi:MAG: GIY-YIG nuclease family protein [Candidatus Anaerobiospirillum pullicola]|uniref:GIY-YIG nuclease family protein n=1 Tax=Candidatus Anaerobiospirillum pullicola TaxID=2838451 RepID=A0A948X0S9_9GAMM|nr:GIY-YIG nuclease family protein [Candidatus Anaerobiospirillum pullicola]
MKLPLSSQAQTRPRNLDELFAADDSAGGLHLFADVKVNPLKHIKASQVAESAQQVLDFVARHKHLPESQAACKDFADKLAAVAWASLQQHYPQEAQEIRVQVQSMLAPQEPEQDAVTPSSTSFVDSAVSMTPDAVDKADTNAKAKLTAQSTTVQAQPHSSHSQTQLQAAQPSQATATASANAQATAQKSASTNDAPKATTATAQQKQPKVYQSIDDIFAEGDALGLFTDIEAAVQIQPQFKLQPESATGYKPRQKAVDTAQAGLCLDYDTYEPLMSHCVELLRSGDLATNPVTEYREQKLRPGQFYLLKGLVALIARSDVDYKEKIRNKNNKPSYRVKVVYNNSTQYTPWNYSFLESLIKDSEGAFFYATTDKGTSFLLACAQKLGAAQEVEEQQRQEQMALEQGKAKGYLYILQSLSTNPVLTQFQQHSELVKIGFCTTMVAERIKNAEHSSTYLYAPVRVVREYPCTDFDPYKFERLVHALLWEHRFNVTLTDKNTGKQYKPQEWFTVSPQTACEIAEHILDGTIMQYRVDSVQGKLVKISSL